MNSLLKSSSARLRSAVSAFKNSQDSDFIVYLSTAQPLNGKKEWYLEYLWSNKLDMMPILLLSSPIYCIISQMDSEPLPVKLVIVGDGAIGKTCILVR